jgi:hypothetical protein
MLGCADSEGEVGEGDDAVDPAGNDCVEAAELVLDKLGIIM